MLIFVSHGEEDRAYATRLAASLDAAGLRTTSDAAQLELSDAVLVIMTPAAARSGAVQAHIARALQLGRPILPLLLDGEPFPSLRHLSYEDVRDGRLPGEAVRSRLTPSPAEEAVTGGLPDVGSASRSAAPPPPPAPAPYIPPPSGYGAPTPQKAAPPARPDTRLQFAAAYRQAIEFDKTYPVLFFVHRPADLARVQEIIGRRSAQLGGAPAVAHASASRDVHSGTILTIVPSVAGATFDPARIEVVAGDTVRELTFQLRVPRLAAPTELDGHIDIFVGPLIIAQVPLSWRVQEVTVPSQPGAAELLKVANASVFDTIFVSYSHKDSEVVDLCVRTYQGLGVDVRVDKHELRSGDPWRPTLQGLIEDADVFQLYWSAAAAASSEVAHECRVALELSRKRDRFIRPLYWETPLPPLPEDLRHLHFGKLDLKALRRAAKAYLPEKPGLLRRALGVLTGSR